MAVGNSVKCVHDDDFYVQFMIIKEKSGKMLAEANAMRCDV